MIQSLKPALTLMKESNVIDLHLDSFIWTRLFHYHLWKRHDSSFTGGRWFGHADLPRLKEANISGAIWSITTNPLQFKRNRDDTLIENLRKLKDQLSLSETCKIVRSFSEYREARAQKKHAAFIGIQGGNACTKPLELLDHIGSELIKVTIVHLLNSELGSTSSPLRKTNSPGLSQEGEEFIYSLNKNKILVDLAHISKAGFYSALKVHDSSQPLIVSHTGVNGIHPHWRNLDDEQIKAIARSGGTIGIIFHSGFLEKKINPFHKCNPEVILKHLEHVIKLVGDDYVSLGSDWDGMITPPKGLESCLGLPLLVQLMLDKKWSEARIQKILGEIFYG